MSQQTLRFTLSTCFAASMLLIAPANAREVHVMSYNVENLFDHLHDPNHPADYTYTSRAFKENDPGARAYRQGMVDEQSRHLKEFDELDWTEEAARAKRGAMASVILKYRAGGGVRCPDVINLVEIENAKVLEAFRQDLKDCGYKYGKIIDGPDKRGANVAVLSRFPIGCTALHSSWQKSVGLESRGIMQTALNIDGVQLDLYGNHWPAPYHDEVRRDAAAKALNHLMTRNATPALAMGDFNTLKQRDPGTGMAKHLVQNGVRNLLMECIEDEGAGCNNPPGTQFFGPGVSWSHLDGVFGNAALLNSPAIQLDPKTGVRIFAPNDIMCVREVNERKLGEACQKSGRSPEEIRDTLLGEPPAGIKPCSGTPPQARAGFLVVPNRYDYRTRQGYSDHLPVVTVVNVDPRRATTKGLRDTCGE